MIGYKVRQNLVTTPRFLLSSSLLECLQIEKMSLPILDDFSFVVESDGMSMLTNFSLYTYPLHDYNQGLFIELALFDSVNITVIVAF